MKIFKLLIKWSALILLPPFIALAFLYSVDQHLHKKYADSYGMNQDGYRGQVLNQKMPSEIRIAALGGSTTFGYGVKTNKSWPSQLERYLNQKLAQESSRERKFSVANLGYNNEGAYAFEPNLRTFRNLDYDIVLFFTGVNDLGGQNFTLFRSDPIFQELGYFSILPIILAEKAKLLEYEGNVEDAYLGKSGLTDNYLKRAIAWPMARLAQLFSSTQEGNSKFKLDLNNALVSSSCDESWRFYCASLLRAIEYSLSENKIVIVVSEPSRGAQRRSQKESVARLISQPGVATTGRLYWFDYTEFLDLENVRISFDKMHLTETGNKIIAKQLIQDLLEKGILK